MTKNLQVVLLVLFLIVLGGFVWYFYLQPESSSSNLPLTDEQRQDSLSEVSKIPPANPKMTDAERLKLMSQPAPSVKVKK